MKDADRIRIHGRQRYVMPALERKQRRFSIRAGNVVQELGISGRAPAVCSALKSREFLKRNNLCLVERIGPPSGQSTTVTYTYEFVDRGEDHLIADPWLGLRGIAKDVFASLGGGEAFIREERANFYAAGTDESAKRRRTQGAEE